MQGSGSGYQLYEYDQHQTLCAKMRNGGADRGCGIWHVNLSYCLKLCAVLRETTPVSDSVAVPRRRRGYCGSCTKGEAGPLIGDYLFYYATDYMHKILTL